MSITFDGHRSLMRKHFAKRSLANARSLGLPSNTTKRDGFLIRVTNLDPDLEMGRVTAPAGAVVACSTAAGVELSSADYYLGGFNPARPAHVLQSIEGSAAPISAVVQGVSSPMAARIPYDPPTPTVPPTVTTPRVTSPVVSSFAGEHYLYAMVGRHKTNIMFFHQSSSLYCDSGSGEKSLTFSAGSNSAEYFACSTAIPSDGGFSVYVSPTGERYMETTNRPYIVGFSFVMNARGQVAFETYQSRVAYGTFPASVRDALSYLDKIILDQGPSHVRTYGFCLKPMFGTYDRPMTMQIVRADNIPFPTVDDSPEYDLMLPIINWSDAISGVILQKSHIEAFCDDMFGVVPHPGRSIDELVLILLYYFGYPCAHNATWTAADSMMIPVDDNSVYCWTRNTGTVRFSAIYGLQKVVSGFNVPALVTATAGVRPNITKSNATRYFCVCEDTATNTVLGLYTGTPFTTWDAVPMPAAGTLLHARPIHNSDTEIIVLGVVQVDADRFFTFLRYIKDEDDNWAGEWQQAGKLPFEVVGEVKWGVCLYGDDPWVNYQQSYLQPPPVVHGDIG